MNIKKLLGKVGKFAKENPEIVLAAAGLASPKLVAKVAPVIIAAVSKKTA